MLLLQWPRVLMRSALFFMPQPALCHGVTSGRYHSQLAALCATVGLFVNATEDEVRAVYWSVCRCPCCSFTGTKTMPFAARFERPWIKALAVKPGQDIMAAIADFPEASGILLDAWHPDLRGGTGHQFDWATFPAQAGKPLILAGGLTPDNVGQAILQTRPYAVDVSGGVEQAKGIKDAKLIAAFLAEVRKAEEHLCRSTG
jgi:phosphoribosylanthranilate isomerase